MGDRHEDDRAADAAADVAEPGEGREERLEREEEDLVAPEESSDLIPDATPTDDEAPAP